MQWFSRIAPQQPKKATRKMIMPMTMKSMGTEMNWWPKKSRYVAYKAFITAPMTISVIPDSCAKK